MQLIKNLIGKYLNTLVLIFPKLAGKQAFYFFCIPFKAKLKPEQNAFLNTAKQTSLAVEGKKVRCYVWGSGPKTILMVHGWQSNSYRWKRYIESLDLSLFRVVSFDAPGHGNSDGLFCNVPLYEKTIKVVIEAFGIPTGIIAHSIGAFSSVYYLHKNNIEVDRLALLAGPYGAIQFVDFFEKELTVSERLVHQMKLHFKVYTGHEVEYFSLDNFAPAIKSNTLVIHDENDEATPVQNSERLVQLLTNADFWKTKGMGHRLKNDKVVKRTVEFVMA